MAFTRSIVATLTLGFALACGAGAAQASAASDAMATVNRFIADFNSGNTNAGLELCDSSVSIIDDFPPHVWRGDTACVDWANAYAAEAKKDGITDGVVRLGTPWHVDVTGNRAYVVAPATYTYKQHGAPVTESGSVFTVALHKTVAGWRITGWAWAQH
jgi:hypothetical protein